MVTIAALTAVYSDNWRAHEAAAWSAVSMLLLYCFCFGISWGPVPWAMPAELFSSSTRAKGVSIAVLSNWLNNAWVGFGTPPLIQRTDFGTFLFFGGESAYGRCPSFARIAHLVIVSHRFLLSLILLGPVVRTRDQGSPFGAARRSVWRQLRRKGARACEQDSRKARQATRSCCCSRSDSATAVLNFIIIYKFLSLAASLHHNVPLCHQFDVHNLSSRSAVL